MSDLWVAIVVGVIVISAITGFICYRLGYEKAYDEVRKYEHTRMFSTWHL